MELRGTVLNVVDFGAFVDVGLSDSGLVHVSQLSSGYVRNPHDVVAVGDQVRVWVVSIDKDRRRVALTMIEPGTEKERPPRNATVTASRAAARSRRKSQSRPVRAKPRHRASAPTDPYDGPRSDHRGPNDPSAVRSATVARRNAPVRYEKRAAKTLKPITKEMEEGKEYLRSFGDLLQFHKKKQEPPKPDADGAPSNDQPPQPNA